MQGLDLLLHFFQQSSFFVGHSARVRGRLVARGHGKREIVRIAAAYLVRLTAYNSQPTLMAIITTTKYAILFGRVIAWAHWHHLWGLHEACAFT